MIRDLPVGGSFSVYYYDARTGRRRADMDSAVGQVYLNRCARDGGEKGEIAVACREDQDRGTDRGTWYLLPGSHEWTQNCPDVLYRKL